jgi:hypothetical protein
MKDRYQVKIKNIDIDIYNYDEILELIQEVIKKVLKINSNGGLFMFEVYQNSLYGIVMDITKLEDKEDSEFEVRIHFHIDSVILVKGDYFYLRDIGVEGTDIYYYDKDFYTLYEDKFGEYDSLVYGEEALKVINDGIRLKI